MRAIFESIFDIMYLTFVIGVGVRLVKDSQNQSGKMFGGVVPLPAKKSTMRALGLLDTKKRSEIAVIASFSN